LVIAGNDKGKEAGYWLYFLPAIVYLLKALICVHIMKNLRRITLRVGA
jgi:hypothetical protein